jgi:predicted Zn-dependent peptidase
MIEYQREVLSNGLEVIVHRDSSTAMATFNILYKVGSRNENPERTGFAHLFEHLMFGGSVNISDFDEPLQLVGGDNNAFTTSDLTNYYINVPAQNIETAFWLESDRMLELAFSQESLDVQRKVVIEEFAQRCMNEPYGDISHLVHGLAYKRHSYRWPTIGLKPEHIAEATLEEVKTFFYSHYAPDNAVLVICGNVDPEKMFLLAEKWFGDIEDTPYPIPAITPEPEQREARRKTVERDVPATTITIAFQMGDRLSRDFFLGDITSDLLAGGDSARLYERLIKKKQLFANVNAYISGDVDRGMFVFTGQLHPTTSEAEAEAAFWEEIDDLKSCNITSYELEKVKNKFEANTLFGELNVMNKAMNLGYYEMIGDLPLINREVDIYRSLSAEDVADFSRRTFRSENSSTLIYRAKR